jgi:hypothetical protein
VLDADWWVKHHAETQPGSRRLASAGADRSRGAHLSRVRFAVVVSARRRQDYHISFADGRRVGAHEEPAAPLRGAAGGDTHDRKTMAQEARRQPDAVAGNPVRLPTDQKRKPRVKSVRIRVGSNANRYSEGGRLLIASQRTTNGSETSQARYLARRACGERTPLSFFS